jgi:predicted ATPase
LLSHLSQSRHHRMRLSGVPRVSLRHLIIVRSLVFEDLHWIDSETQAWLDSLVESLPTARMLLLVNYRPEYQHRWGSKTFYTQLRLDPLPPTRADEFLRALLGDDPSLEPLKTLLIARTEGNPFFLEESVRTLLETQVLAGKVGDYRLARDLPTIQIPATVQAILAARIDRLTQDEKRLLQTAAVIGSDIPLSLLQAIAEMPDASLHPGLTHLQTAEFLYETSLFPERVFTFKHALTHEVAYSSLLQERRRGLHGRILEALEGQTEDRRTEQVERLAHHAWRGEVWDKALTYMRQAGTKAMARSASREAMVCFEQALAAIDHLPERRDLQEQAIDLRLGLRGARLVLSDFKGSLNDLREAERLAQALDDAQRLGRVWLYMAGAFTVTGAYEQATAFAQRALDAALTRQETGLQAHAHNYLGWITYSQGAYTPSRDHCRQARALLEGDLLYERFDEIAFPAVFCRTFLAFCLAELGAFAEGVAMGSEGLHLAEAVDHPVSLAVALWGTGTTYLHQGELRPALALLERSVHICREANLTFHFSSVATALGAAYILHGRVADALPLLEEAVGQAVPMGSRFYHAGTVTTLSDAHLHAGHLEAARTLAEQALDRSHTYNERGSEAYALRLLGAITMHRDPPDVEQAEAHYQHALALADELGMRPLQAHCHRGLGTLYSQTGQAEQARTELSTAIAIYRDMAMTFWLPETEAALADVEVR